MANQPVSAFARTFANRDLFFGPARGAIIWSVLASVLLACVLICLGLLVGLLTEQGNLFISVTDNELQEFNRFTGFQFRHMGPKFEEDRPQRRRRDADGESDQRPAAEPPSDLPDDQKTPISTVHEIYGEGVIGSVWRTHGRWYGPAFSWLYRHVDWLRHNDQALVTLLVTAIICWLARIACLAGILRQSQVAALRASLAFRKNLHRQALRLGPEEISDTSDQSVVHLFNEQVEAIRNGLEQWIHRLTRYPLEILTALLIASQIDFLLTIIWAIPLILCWFLIERAGTRLVAATLLAQDRLRGEYRTLSEQLSNARLVRGLGMEQPEHEEFVKRLEHTLKPAVYRSATEREAVWLQRLTAPICAIILFFLLVSLGLKLLHGTGEISWPGAVVFVCTVALTLRGVRQLWNLRPVKDQIAVAANQVFRYLDRMPTVSQAVGAKFLQPLSRSLHFDAVTYRTSSQRPLLDRLTLKLDAKKSYAVVSLDPVEAKAFAMMLPRFIEPQSGRVLVDGEDIAWATLESLRAEAVYVGGDDPPLRGTVLENLRAGNPQATLQQATEAAKTAHAHNFIVKMSQGYESMISGRDSELDASQRFRLALARAILRNPALLIIEEPQVIFDEDTKQLIDDTYQRILPGRTVVFLPSRLSTLKRVDEIIFLQNGQIAAQGTQATLVSQSPIYRHWEYLHFNEFRKH